MARRDRVVAVAAYRNRNGKNGDVAKAAIETLESRVLLTWVPFGTEQRIETGAGPGMVVVGDFNGDGKADMATANYGQIPDYNGSVSILLGNGDGTFRSRIDYDLDSTPSALSHYGFRVNRLELDSGVSDLELPVDPSLPGIAVFMPGRRFRSQRIDGAETPVPNALTCHRA